MVHWYRIRSSASRSLGTNGNARPTTKTTYPLGDRSRTHDTYTFLLSTFVQRRDQSAAARIPCPCTSTHRNKLEDACLLGELISKLILNRTAPSDAYDHYQQITWVRSAPLISVTLNEMLRMFSLGILIELTE